MASAWRLAEECLRSGQPRKKWDDMLAAQGADLEAFRQKLACDHTAPVVVEVKASQAGYLQSCDARILGETIRDLGGGRLTKESVINYEVGVDRLAKPGAKVARGSLLARIHAADEQQAAAASLRLHAAFKISARKPRPTPLLRGVITRSK